MGDAVLALPRRLFGGAPIVMLLIAIALAGAAILCLSACDGLRARATEADEFDEDELPARHRPAVGGEDVDEAGEPGLALVSLGAMIHAGLTFKSALVRRLARMHRKVASAPLAPWQAAAQRINAEFEQDATAADRPAARA